ncbi:MAG: hypothetical protein ACI87E_005330 [Mariniblastus sp.]|jgi:hypothetical protein
MVVGGTLRSSGTSLGLPVRKRRGFLSSDAILSVAKQDSGESNAYQEFHVDLGKGVTGIQRLHHSLYKLSNVKFSKF